MNGRLGHSATGKHRVAVWAGFFLPGFKGGGPVKSLVEMLDRLPPNVVCVVVAADRDLGDTSPYPGLSGRAVPWGRHTIVYANWRRPLATLRLLRRANVHRIDLLYLNSFWSPVYTMAPLVALRLGVVKADRVLIAPRGQLSSGALSLKSHKKRLAMKPWARVLSAAQPLFQVSTDLEAAEVREQLPWARTIIQINSRGPEPLEHPVAAGDVARFIFLGRISPKKNVAFALAALTGLSSRAVFDIFGPIEDEAYWRHCSEAIARIPNNVTVRYHGPVAPEKVAETFSRYDAFIFPTLGENFGHVIAESLAAGCPVVCTDRTPWSAVFEAGGGVVVRDLAPTAWSRELEYVASLDQAARSERKVLALTAYRAWRRTAVDPPAIEVALGDLSRRGT